jgi:cobaltochelatase CobN
MLKRIVATLAVSALFVALGLWSYSNFLRPYRIAIIGFADTDWANWEEAIRRTPYSLYRYGDDGIDVAPLDNFNLVFIRGQGLNLTPEQVEKIAKARTHGTHFYVRTATNALSEQQTSLTEEHRKKIADYLKHGGRENLMGMAHYAAHHLGRIDVTVPDIVEKPQFGFFHANDVIHQDIATFDKYLDTLGIPADAPRVGVLGAFMDPQDQMNREPLDTIINALEKAGARVYPVFGRQEVFTLLRDVKPELLISFPHGRLTFSNDGERLLREIGCPIISALPLLNSSEKWLEDERGMEGGFLGQSITSPELDGIIEPIVISSMEPNERKLSVRKSIDDRVQTRVSLAINWLKLRRKSNTDKKLVIVYYKSPGMAALSAGGLEVAPALWNTLKRLQDEGYDLGNALPETPDKLFELIQTKGKTLGQWAIGSYDQFLQEASPQLVAATQYGQWFQQALSPKRQKETIELWGDIPGKKMVTEKDGIPHLVISRIQLGNIVIMPQPTVGGGEEGENEISSIHGTDQAAPHFYLGAYLWARYGFQADAILHFGTHGSLEFTYGKSNCLSRDCWPQILIGDLPHIYPYVINNVGEALVAKRRSNAVIVSHLTPPFMEAGLYGDLSLLHDKIHDWEQVEDPLLREETLKSVTSMVRDLKMATDLGLNEAELEKRQLTETELTAVHNYIHQLKDQSVTEGLHVIGRTWTDKQVAQTSAAMIGDQGVDRILAALGKANDPDAMEYRLDLTRQIVDEVLSGELSTTDLFTPEEIATFNEPAAPEQGRRGGRPGASGSNASPPQAAPSADNPSGGHPPEPTTRRGHPGSIPRTERPDAPAAGKPNQPAQTLFSPSASRTYLVRFSQAVTDVPPQVSADEPLRMFASPPDNGEPPTPTDSPVVEAKKFWNYPAELRASLTSAVNERKLFFEIIQNISINANNLRASPQIELEQIVAALNAKYISPSSGGDPLGNPASLPTGRNLYSINAEQTPSEEAWRVAIRLTNDMLASHRAENNGEYPKQVAISMWGGEFIRGKGTEIAQVLYLMGMRPMWNSRGVVYDVEVIPSAELKRPRIDVLVQTSGQFRDAAASRIALIDKAVQIANQLEPEAFPNFVREGTDETEQTLKSQGISAKDARDFATARIFGSASNSSYGTQIMGMVEKGDSWGDEKEVADRYVQNMSGVYRDGERWGTVLPGLLEAQMQGVEVVVHPRSSNTWGPLSLDHVYEFMGGITLAVRNKTGKDPKGYFSDLRQPGRAKVTTAVGAIREEARTTLWNPKFIQGMQKEGPSAAAALTETVRNMYGWNVMQPSSISQDMWDETYNVYIDDKHKLEMREYFEAKNPYALQDMTAVMLETARKGYWTPSQEVLQNIAELHTELVAEHGAACSYETCGNKAFHEFLQQQLSAPGSSVDPATNSQYQQALASVLEPATPLPEVNGIQMEEVVDEEKPTTENIVASNSASLILYIVVAAMLAMAVGLFKK